MQAPGFARCGRRGRARLRSVQRRARAAPRSLLARQRPWRSPPRCPWSRRSPPPLFLKAPFSATGPCRASIPSDEGKSRAGVQSSKRAGLVRAKIRRLLLSTLLPLFPLDLVLLPGTKLPLHIFEPRYKELAAECLAQNKPFGVVRAKEEGVAEIGCTAEILSVAKKYADGRMDVITRGVRRFEVMEVNQERSFLQ